MNNSSPSSRSYLLMVAIIAIVTFAGVYLLNQIPDAQPSAELATIAANSADAPVPTRLPVEVINLTEESPVIEDVITAADFDPIRIQIDSAEIDVEIRTVGVNAQGFVVTPSGSAGFWIASAKLNEPGNTVIVGHNHDQPVVVFRNLAEVAVEDEIRLTDTKAREHVYVIRDIQIIAIDNAPASEAERIIEMMNVQPTDSQQLTIVSCHPAPDCPDRIVVIAESADSGTN